MSKKHLKLRSETAYAVLGQEINLAIQQALPISLQQAGISPDLIKPYLAAVMTTLAPATAHYVTQALYSKGLCLMGDAESPVVRQIQQSFTNAASGVVNAVQQPVQQYQPQQPRQAMPLQPQQPQAQNVVPIRQPAPAYQNGDTAPEII